MFLEADEAQSNNTTPGRELGEVSVPFVTSQRAENCVDAMQNKGVE